MGNDIDPEWVELIFQAKELGLTDEEIREFFVEVKNRETLVGR